MNLYNYLEQLSSNQFIDANGFFLYNKLVSYKDIKEINKKNDIRLLTIKEFSDYLINKEENFLKLISQIKSENQTRIKIFLKDPQYSYYYNLKSKTFEHDLNDKDIKEGIFLSKSNKILKNFKKISDLRKENIGLLITENKGNIIRIVCYDNDVLKQYSNLTSKFISPILFFGKIKDDGRDNSGKKTPYNSSIVAVSAVRSDVSGYNILYPILAYFAKNNLLISDRGSVSDSAQKVWQKFYDGKGKLERFNPIDNALDPITQSEIDDGKIYNNDKYKESGDRPNDEIFSDPNLSEVKRKYFLRKIRISDVLNWTYQLPNSEISSMHSDIEYLINNHKKNKPKDEFVLGLASDLFLKRVVS